MRLGILDIQGVLEHTVELAPDADRQGYSCYWLTEFPPAPSPLTLAAAIAGITERIRVGTAAILFNYYAPRRSAHDFQLLERLYEGRIDAGLSSSTALEQYVRDDLDGRDPGELLQRYPERFERFLAHLRNTPGSPDYVAETAWIGAPLHPPAVWSLGSGRAADLAARHGTAFGYPLMYQSAVDDPSVVERYRTTFAAARSGDRPRAVVAICGVCGDDDEAANAGARQWGGRIFVPTVIGSAASCAEQLAALRMRYRVDEVIYADLNTDLGRRRDAQQALAEAAAKLGELSD